MIAQSVLETSVDQTDWTDELPVLWACGVTPQVAVREARPPLSITHTPGHMVLTDLRNAALAIL